MSSMDESPLLSTTDDSTVSSSTSPSSGTDEHVALLSPLTLSPDNGTSTTNISSCIPTPDSGIDNGTSATNTSSSCILTPDSGIDNGTSATNTSSSHILTPDSGIDESDNCVEETKTKHHKNQPPDGNLLPPCRVCGEKASGLHYGANTCEPCKVSYTVKPANAVTSLK